MTRAANLSKDLSQYLSGNWSEGFDSLLDDLRGSIAVINSTRVYLSLAARFSTWISSAFSYFKEWAGVGLFGAALCCGLVFIFWMVCRLKAQSKRDKLVVAQALAALEQGASPDIWLAMLKQ